MKQKKDRTGEKRILSDGTTMVCTRYNNANDISVRFSNGLVLEHTTWEKFVRRKTVGKCKDWRLEREGAVNYATNGQRMQVINYRTYHDLDVRFDDGTIIPHKTWQDFRDGRVRNPNIHGTNSQRLHSRIGTEIMSTSGQKMKIIAYRNCEHLDVQFEDGTIVRDKRWDNFRIGHIANPNVNGHCVEEARQRREGMMGIAKNGLRMKLVAYRSAKDVDVMFEDGIITQHKTMRQFNIGEIPHPGLSNTYRLHFCKYNVRMVFRTTDFVFYDATNRDTGERFILSPQMMMRLSGIKSVF